MDVWTIRVFDISIWTDAFTQILGLRYIMVVMIIVLMASEFMWFFSVNIS